MRKFIALTAAAPLALLAACGDNDTEVPADTDADLTAIDDTGASAETMAAGPATSLADAGDYSGTYSVQTNDGTQRGITLNATDSTYSYVNRDGTERTGRYTITTDGYRMAIDDFYGEPAYFTISNGDLVKLQSDVDITPDIEVSGERYSRSQGDDAVFSREPQLGSPVAPQD